MLRHYGNLLRLSPFRFEDWLAALRNQENSVLLSEVHIALLKALLRADEQDGTWLCMPDQNHAVNGAFYLVDSLTWPALLRWYMTTDEEYPPLSADYPFVPVADKVSLLRRLTDRFLITPAVRAAILGESVIRYEDFCRCCHKMGDLLCCDTCPGVFHLHCLDPPLTDIPNADWQCPVCVAQRTSGVTDCISEWEKSGQMHRQEPLGRDRHGGVWWFMARRVWIEMPDESELRYYSSAAHQDQLF